MASYSTNATLTEREFINDELIILRIQPDGAMPNFEPGQYAELALIEDPSGIASKIERRQYSIASAPGDTRGLEFYLVLVPGGFLTPKLWQLRVGERLWMNPLCKGKFTLEPVPPGMNLLLISTGTGLAPYISMLRKYLATGPASDQLSPQTRWNKVTVVHGARYARDLGYADELQSLSQAFSDVHYLPCTTREAETSAWSGVRGRLPAVFEAGHYESLTGCSLDPQTTQVFLCGNPEMIDAMQAFFEARGFRLHKKKEPGQIHLERYW